MRISIGWVIFFLILAFGGGFVLSRGIPSLNWSMLENQYTPDKLMQLSLHMNSKYWRGLDKNDFSLYYEPVPPNKIRVAVRFRPNADITLVSSVARAAEDQARGVARDRFGIQVLTEIDMAPVAAVQD